MPTYTQQAVHKPNYSKKQLTRPFTYHHKMTNTQHTHTHIHTHTHRYTHTDTHIHVHNPTNKTLECISTVTEISVAICLSKPEGKHEHKIIKLACRHVWTHHQVIIKFLYLIIIQYFFSNCHHCSTSPFLYTNSPPPLSEATPTAYDTDICMHLAHTHRHTSDTHSHTTDCLIESSIHVLFFLSLWKHTLPLPAICTLSCHLHHTSNISTPFTPLPHVCTMTYLYA